MVIYTTIVSVLLVLSFVVNILFVASWQIVKENSALEDEIKYKG